MREIPRATSKVTSTKSPLAPDEHGGARKKPPPPSAASLNGRHKTTSPPSAKTDANNPVANPKDNSFTVSARESMISDISSSRPNSTASEGGDFISDIEDEEEDCGVDDETTTEYSESCRDDEEEDDDDDDRSSSEAEEANGLRAAAVLDPISEETSLANKTSDDG